MKVLVVEDEVLVGLDIMDTLVSAGHVPNGPFSDPSEALVAISADRPDLAVLDVNLGSSKTSEPVAVLLEELDIPFIFLSGETRCTCSLLRMFHGVPKLPKPMNPEDLLHALEEVSE